MEKFETLRDIYENSLKEYGARAAFSQIDGVSYTYSDFGKVSRRFAALLEHCGIGKGEKVILFSGSQPNWPLAYLTVTSTSRIILPLLPDFTAFELANIVEHSEAKDILISKRLYYKLSESVCCMMRTIIILDDMTIARSEKLGIGLDGKMPLESCVAADLDWDKVADAVFGDEKYRPAASEVASIIYTSGTSGSSKGVMLTHKNLVSQLVMLESLFPVNGDDVFLSILPLSHAYECSLGMLYPFKFGASVVYMNGAPTPTALMAALKKVKPTVMLSVPLIVEKIYKNKVRPVFTKNFYMQFLYSIPFIRRAFHKAAGKKLLEMFGGRLRFFGVGGSKLDGAVERFLKDAGFPYGIGYGLTETSPLLAGAVPGKVPFQSTGPIVAGVSMKLNNINSHGIGEIVVKGDNVMLGYYKDEARTKAAFTEDGWFRTRDLGKLDSKGNLYIKGRVDNMIVGANGENIYPEEIESIINENDFVAESLVVQIKGHLIAKVHFNYDQIAKIHKFSESSVKNLAEKIDEIKKELKEYVNSKVNKASKVEIEEQQVPFEKTATQKIKRYLYTS